MSNAKHDLIASPLTNAPPELGAPTVTVGEIAARLHEISTDKEATAERVRSWTREGFLHPVAHYHAGTGKHRRYDPISAFDAAILSVIADAGLRIAGQQHLHHALSLAREALQNWKEGGSVFLEIARSKEGDWIVAVHEDAVARSQTAALSILINLGRIFADVARERGFKRSEL